MERWLAAGHTLRVLNCFTKSEYAPYSDAASLHPNDRASFVFATRKREDVAFNKLLGGALEITDLDLLDAPLRLACGADEVLTVDIRPGDRALARVAGALRKLASGGAALAVPLAVGGHIDHRVVHEAALEVLRDGSMPAAFYEDLPYATRPGAAETTEACALATGMTLQPGFALEAAPVADVAAKRKRRFADCYDSQIDSEVAADIAAFSQRYGGRERLWANSAWQAAVAPFEPVQANA